MGHTSCTSRRQCNWGSQSLERRNTRNSPRGLGIQHSPGGSREGTSKEAGCRSRQRANKGSKSRMEHTEGTIGGWSNGGDQKINRRNLRGRAVQEDSESKTLAVVADSRARTLAAVTEKKSTKGLAAKATREPSKDPAKE